MACLKHIHMSNDEENQKTTRNAGYWKLPELFHRHGQSVKRGYRSPLTGINWLGKSENSHINFQNKMNTNHENETIHEAEYFYMIDHEIMEAQMPMDENTGDTSTTLDQKRIKALEERIRVLEDEKNTLRRAAAILIQGNNIPSD